ncbi:MAG: malic enzyme-like NAD(P)-binding protein [Acidimicrobiales bacterium]
MQNAPTAAFSITLKIALDNVPGSLGRFATAIGEAGGNIAAIPGFEAKGPTVVRAIDVHCRSEEHAEKIAAAVDELDGVTVLEWWDRTYKLHEGGKIEVLPLCSVGDADDLAMAYTPGVARVCMSIHHDEALAHQYTIKKNTVAIVSAGSAVLGLGNIGPAAAMPVMEGTALLFKEFGGVDGFPICLDTQDTEEIIETVIRLAPTFGGINLEDIAAPACFEIEERLKAALDIPVFHDDQHGTAVVALAALNNSLKIVDKKMGDISVVISGMGAAGVACGKILLDAGVGGVIGVDRLGAVHEGRDGLNDAKQWFATHTNRDRRAGTLREVLAGADVFMGVSAPNLLDASDIRSMAKDPIVFAMANPDPEIRPGAGRRSGGGDGHRPLRLPEPDQQRARLPWIFARLDANAHSVTENMKVSAAAAIAACVSEDRAVADLRRLRCSIDRLLPWPTAVADAAVADGVVRG